MTNTTQLLMDAAKSAGYNVQFDGDVAWRLNPETCAWEEWKPRESDADAFRLFVKIRNLGLKNPVAWDDQPDSMQRAWIEVTDALDSGDEARCRLAITTLAAEMHRAAAQSQEKGK